MTLNLKNRLKAFKHRTHWLSNFTDGAPKAICYQISSKFKPDLVGQGSYKNTPLAFRKGDLQALEEVLILEEYDFITEVLQESKTPVIFDIGAHIGTFALWCFSKNKGAQILSLEADPETFAVLSQNRKTADKPAWTILNRAGWSSDETLSFRNSGATMSHKVAEDGEIKVQGITLADLMKQVNTKNIDVLKIDIEGAEEAFLTAQPELLKNVKNLIIEIHPQICSEDNIRTLLAKYFTSITDVSGRQSSKPLLWCRNAKGENS